MASKPDFEVMNDRWLKILLMILCGNDQLSRRELARALGISLTRAQQSIAKMRKRGFLCEPDAVSARCLQTDYRFIPANQLAEETYGNLGAPI